MTNNPDRPVAIEVCVENADGLVAARRAGADRVEFCAALIEGGLTPSSGIVEEAIRLVRVPFNVIVRPRGGDFLCSPVEFAAMMADVAALQQLGVNGVVIGCLTPDGAIDEVRMKALVDAARPLSVTCHRTFDMTRDAGAAVEALIRCGVNRVLTSGLRGHRAGGSGDAARDRRDGAWTSDRDGLRRARRRKHRPRAGRHGRAKAALRGLADGAERNAAP